MALSRRWSIPPFLRDRDVRMTVMENYDESILDEDCLSVSLSSHGSGAEYFSLSACVTRNPTASSEFYLFVDNISFDERIEPQLIEYYLPRLREFAEDRELKRIAFFKVNGERAELVDGVSKYPPRGKEYINIFKELIGDTSFTVG